MLDAGMNVARLNFSHGDHTSHGKSLDNLREALKQRPDKTCAVMLDTKGPEIRTGLLKDGKPIELQANQDLKISTDYTLQGDTSFITCSYKSLPTTVKVGSTIFIADGSLTCTVTALGDVSTFFVFLIFTGSRHGEVPQLLQNRREEKHELARSRC